jgi:hypothetical protein
VEQGLASAAEEDGRSDAAAAAWRVADGLLRPTGGQRAERWWEKVGSAGQRVGEQLLPKGYPRSVSSSYLRYSACAAGAAVFSAAGGVLSMQAMLSAVLGLQAGSVGSGAVAATLNWVLKDGLGQLGGVLFAGLVNTRFDRDVKRWRLGAAALLEAANALELLTAFWPALFLPLAAVANMWKNAAWLSASATRAGIHQALAVQGNLADVTAKSGSQTTAASLAGTALGMGASWAAATVAGASGWSVPGCMVAVWACGAVAHMVLLHLALQRLVLPTLNAHRCEAVVAHVLRTGAVPPPELLAGLERVWRGNDAFPGAWPIVVGAPVDSLPRFPHALNHAWRPHDKFIVHLEPSASPRVSLLLTRDAAWSDVLSGYFQAAYLRSLTATAHAASDEHALLLLEHAARDWIAQHRSTLLHDCEARGWWVGQPLVEPDVAARILIQPE